MPRLSEPRGRSWFRGPAGSEQRMDSAGSYPPSQPQRGLMRGLWSMVSSIGLSASSTQGADNGSGGRNFDETCRAFHGWTRWWRYRSAKRRVAEHINLLCTEAVARRHLIKWFEHCESGLSPRARANESDLSEMGEFVRTAPETVVAPDSNSCVVPTEDGDFLMSPKMSPLGGSNLRLATSRETNDLHPSRKIKDMRPAALTADAKPAMLQRGQSPPPSPLSSLASFATLVHEPCPSPKAGAVWSGLQASIREMQQGRRPIAVGMPPLSSARSPAAVLIPEVLVQSSEAKSGSSAGSNSEAEASQIEGGSVNSVATSPRIIPLQVFPNNSGEDFPLISRSPSADKSGSSFDKAPSFSPTTDMDMVMLQEDAHHTSECDLDYAVHEHTANASSHVDGVTRSRGSQSWVQTDTLPPDAFDLDQQKLANLARDIERIKERSFSSGSLHDIDDMRRSSQAWRDASCVVSDTDVDVETPSPVDSRGSDDVMLGQAFRVLDDKGDQFCLSGRLSSPIRKVARSDLLESPQGSATSGASRRRLITPTCSRASSFSRSFCSVGTYAEECMNSMIFEHDFRLVVRAVRALQDRVHEKRVEERVIASRRCGAQRHFLRSWCQFAEDERRAGSTARLVFGAWQTFFRDSILDMQEAQAAASRRLLDRFLQCWSACALEMRAGYFRAERCAKCFLLAWSASMDDLRAMRVALTAWRILDLQQKLNFELYITKSALGTLSACVIEWRDAVMSARAMFAYEGLVSDILREEIDAMACDTVPAIVDFRWFQERRARSRMLCAWRNSCRMQRRLDANFHVQCQRSDHFRCAVALSAWLEVAQFLRASKLRLMNPTTLIEGLTLPSPTELLRIARGDVGMAKEAQQGLQIQIIVAMLGNRVSEPVAQDLLEHASGDTWRALQAGMYLHPDRYNHRRCQHQLDHQHHLHYHFHSYASTITPICSASLL